MRFTKNEKILTSKMEPACPQAVLVSTDPAWGHAGSEVEVDRRMAKGCKRLRVVEGHSGRYQAPNAWQARAERRTHKNVVIEIPYRRLACARIVEHIIRVAIAIKIRCCHDCPAA